MNKKQFKKWFDECIEEREDEEDTYYTIKLFGTKKEKAEGFYALLINGSTFSDELNVWQGIDKYQLRALKKTKCPYEVVK